MPLITGVGNTFARIPSPKWAQRGFLATAKEGKARILPLEGAVLGGRSLFEWIRTGFLGLQESLFQEAAAAYVWLYGVNHLQRLFDKMKPKLFRGMQHLAPDTAWTRPWGKSGHVDLNPREVYTTGASELKKLLRMQGIRWFFSVGLATGVVAYLIPAANQWKTNLLLCYYNKHNGKLPQRPGFLHKQPGPATSRISTGRTRTSPARTSLEQPAALSFPGQPSFLPSFSPAFSQSTGFPRSDFSLNSPTTAYNQPFAASAAPSRWARHPSLPANGFTRPGVPSTLPYFGLNMGYPLGNKAMQGLGYLVDHTPNGDILAIDVLGIDIGRGYTASKRSKFETVEVLFRDTVSLYFYILFAPHVMRLIASGIDPMFKTSMRLEPHLAEALQAEVKKGLAAHVKAWARSQKDGPAIVSAFEQEGRIPKRFIQEMLMGASNEKLMTPASQMIQHMRIAPMQTTEAGEGFMPLLRKEMAAYGLEDPAALQATLEASLKRELNLKSVPTELMPGHIQRILDEIAKKDGAFSKLDKAQRVNLSLAVKQAFRHTAGLSVTGLKNGELHLNGKPLSDFDAFSPLMGELSSYEQSALEKRIAAMARMDALDQANTMLRRSLNLARGHMQQSEPLAHVEAMADWLDRSVMHHLTPEELIRQEMETIRLFLPEESRALFDNPLSNFSKIEAALAGQKGRKARQMQETMRSLKAALQSPDPSQFAARAGENEPQALGRLLRKNIQQAFETLRTHGPAKGADADLIRYYQEASSKLLDGDAGRLFSLVISGTDEGLTQKLREMLLGGLTNDTAFIRRMQGIMGQFTEHSRLHVNPNKSKQMRENLQHYGNQLLTKLEASADSVEQGGRTLFKYEGFMDNFLKLNRNLNYVARIVSTVGAMLCLGALVPKLQNLMTKWLTGKDENPGISSAEKALGLKNAPSGLK